MDFKKAKEWITASLTADQLLSTHPCLISHLSLIVEITGAVSTALIYDGESTSGKLKLGIQAVAKRHASDDFSVPVYFERGIFVDVGDNTTLFTIQYKEEIKE